MKIDSKWVLEHTNCPNLETSFQKKYGLGSRDVMVVLKDILDDKVHYFGAPLSKCYSCGHNTFSLVCPHPVNSLSDVAMIVEFLGIVILENIDISD